jgi:hypothetical protein
MMRPNYVAKMAIRQGRSRTTLFGDPVISGLRDLTRLSLARQSGVEKHCRRIVPISTHISYLLLVAGMTKGKGGYQASGLRQANLKLR